MLADTNILIYAAAPSGSVLRHVSVVSRVEALGFHRITDAEEFVLHALFGFSVELPIDKPVIARAVALRQQRKMSLGDALIAATALEHGLSLATHNVRDFDWIDGLDVIDSLVS